MKKSAVIIFLAFLILTFPVFSGFSDNAYSVKYVYPDRFLMGAFSTYYGNSSAERKHNIKLSTLSINNVYVDVGAEFSFNKVVGNRTYSRGYQNAKIIKEGEFTEGIGGGVCQVSTTLYNAVLLSGLKVIERHAHTLQVSYVEPSFDAMVNYGVSDLRFINDSDSAIYIRSISDGENITVKIFGKKPKYKIVRRFVIINTIEMPYDEKDGKEYGLSLQEGERVVIKQSKSGIVSEGYLDYYENGKLIKSVKKSTDRYKGTKGIIAYFTKP